MKIFLSPKRHAASGKSSVSDLVKTLRKKDGCLLLSTITKSVVLFALLVPCVTFVIYSDSLSEIKLMDTKDTLFTNDNVTSEDSILKDSAITQDYSYTAINDTVSVDTLPANSTDSPKSSAEKKKSDESNELTNIVLTTKGIRASGWGEYRVGGRCLCCDNLLDGDCIIVHNSNRTRKTRIKQIVDGKIEADSSDKTTYFGDVMERDRPEFVEMLMVEITLKTMIDIYKIVVYTMAGNKKKKAYLSNCELGYYDQFDRLQWVGKVVNKKHNDRVFFEMKKPIFTKSLLLKIKDGKSRITEVAIFCKNDEQ